MKCSGKGTDATLNRIAKSDSLGQPQRLFSRIFLYQVLRVCFYLLCFLHYIVFILKARSPAHIYRIQQGLEQNLGFDHLIYNRFIHNQQNSIESPKLLVVKGKKNSESLQARFESIGFSS